MPSKIVQKNSKTLREKTKDLKISEITSAKIKKVIKEMSAALASQSDGVAIAAPQIGQTLSIFVVSGKIFHPDFVHKNKEEFEKISKKEMPKDLVFINPKIIKLSKEKEWMPEGCLSVRWLYGETHRAKKVTIAAYNEKGEKIQRGASGLLAQIFQHEIDHLRGILFIDKARNLKEELPEK